MADTLGRETREFKTVTVFCGSSMGKKEEYKAAAIALGKELSRRKLRLVYGGGNVGLMGIIAQTVMQESGPGSVIGVIPKELCDVEVSGEMNGETRVVDGMHERKAMMSELADGFICLPGGYGTLEEALEMITWQQLGYHTKPVGLLNISGFYDHLLTHFRHSVEEGFVRPTHKDIVLSSCDASDLIDKMQSYQPPMSHIQAAKAGDIKLDHAGGESS